MRSPGESRWRIAMAFAALPLFAGCAGEIAANEQSAIEALKEFVRVQKAHREAKQTYADTLDALEGLPEGMRTADSPETGWNGYYYRFVEFNGMVPMDYATEFVLCAIPCEHGETGQRTFAIGPRGIVLAKDNGGKPVDNATRFSDGSWVRE